MVPQHLGFKGCLKGVRGLVVGRDRITGPQTSTSIQKEREIKGLLRTPLITYNLS